MRLVLASLCLFLLFLLCDCSEVLGQEGGGITSTITNLPDRFLEKVNDKAQKTNAAIDKQTEKYLSKLQKQEEKLKRKLQKIDSLAANNIFNEALTKYEGYSQKITDKSAALSSKARQYIPFFDTLKTSLKFLEQHKDVLKNIKTSSAQLKESLGQLQQLDDKLAQAEQIRAFIRERKQVLAEQLKKFGLSKELTKYNKQAYYYVQQINEYKAILNDPDKLLEKSIQLISKLPAFGEFMSKHSELASLFRIPGTDPLATASNGGLIPGLQSRAQVQGILQQQLQAAGPNAQAMMQQQVQTARQQLNQLKDKINQLGGSSSDIEMPEGFKPNNQKTKSFWKRLEYGTNIQSTRSNSFWPATTDFGISIAFKANDKSIIGVGTSYKLGLGKDIRNIRFSHQGMSLRSFMDYKIKGSFFVAGGAELNYRSEFRNFEILKDYRVWSQSALLGLSKKYNIGKKYKGNMQLLYDFLWQQQIPRTQPVLFRLGYSFK
jgi:hypothetical protein